MFKGIRDHQGLKRRIVKSTPIVSGEKSPSYFDGIRRRTRYFEPGTSNDTACGLIDDYKGTFGIHSTLKKILEIACGWH